MAVNFAVVEVTDDDFLFFCALRVFVCYLSASAVKLIVDEGTFEELTLHLTFELALAVECSVCECAFAYVTVCPGQFSLALRDAIFKLSDVDVPVLVPEFALAIRHTFNTLPSVNAVHVCNFTVLTLKLAVLECLLEVAVLLDEVALTIQAASLELSLNRSD